MTDFEFWLINYELIGVIFELVETNRFHKPMDDSTVDEILI
jgi:hypothetical protein